MLERLEQLEAEGLLAIATADSETLEGLRVAYLGKQGHVAQILRTLGQLPKEDRKALGQGANRVKGRLSQAIGEREKHLADAALQAELGQRLDLSLPGAEGAAQGLYALAVERGDLARCVYKGREAGGESAPGAGGAEDHEGPGHRGVQGGRRTGRRSL